MIRNINGFLLLFLVSFFSSCKKNEALKETSEKKKSTIESVDSKENSQYKTWFFSSQNKNSTYKDIKISLSNDSIKVINGSKLICSGEILQSKSTFTEYFKSAKNGDLNREQLAKDYNFNFGNDIVEISNIYGDLTEKGCLFPFNNMFIVDNHMFYYDKGYHCFTQNKEKTSVTEAKVNSYIEKSDIQLPYDKKIDLDNVKYKRVKVDKIVGLDDFSCGEEEARYIPILSKNNIDLILVPQDCADFPYRFYLLSLFENKIISNLYVEGEFFEPENFDNKAFTSFKIDDKQLIQVKTIEKNREKIKSEKITNYRLSESGKILKI